MNLSIIILIVVDILLFAVVVSYVLFTNRYRFMQNLPTAEEREELKELVKMMDNQIRASNDAYKHFAHKADEIDGYLDKIEKSFDDRKREIDLLALRLEKRMGQADLMTSARFEPGQKTERDTPANPKILDEKPWDPVSENKTELPHTGDKYDEALRLAKEGVSKRDIAERVHLSESEVDVILSLKKPKQ